MSKNKVLILITITILLSVGLFYFWSKYIKKTETIQTTDSTTTAFPFDSRGGQDTKFTPSTPYNDNQSSFDSGVDMPILRQISENPIAGGIAFGKGSTTVIRYVERGTGHIIETTADSYDSNKISNTTILKIPQAIWAPDGQSVIMRYIEEGTEKISSFSANIIKATTTQDISKNPKSVFLPANIIQLSVNPFSSSENRIFYLTKDLTGSTGIVSNMNGDKRNQVLKSPITEWLISWTNKETIALATKPSSVVAGYLFFLSEKTGKIEKILSGINGLTALVSSTTKNILYSESDDESVKLNYHNLKDNQGKTLSFKTLPEKCVWSKTEELTVYCAVPKTIEGGNYPDDWYQGFISFNDNVWKIDLKTNSSEIIYNPQKEIGKEFDIVDIFLSNNDEYVFFTNKKDLTFWSLSLKKQQTNTKQIKNPDYF